MVPAVSIVIPTRGRPGPLATALASALAQTGVSGGFEVVVVDNDREPSARAGVMALTASAGAPLVYVHEPRPGVAHARNSGIAAARAPLIAFLDDDEEAPTGWLAGLMQVQTETSADVVFGPVRGRAPDSVGRHRAYLERFFSRVGPEVSGPIPNYYGCGNSLIRRAALPDSMTPFDPIRNLIGGEDDLLFGRMQAAGARFAWADEAWVHEDPVPSRLNLRYALARAFAYGQGPSSHCAAQTPPNWPGVIGWMGVGVIQTVIHGVPGVIKYLIGAPGAADSLDRAARGLGKTFWGGPMKIAFYGPDSSSYAP